VARPVVADTPLKIVLARSLALVAALAATPALAQSSATVDHGSGLLTITTPDGQLNVKFPPAAVQNVKPGDHVTVAFG
jgi:hypothetical protein